MLGSFVALLAAVGTAQAVHLSPDTEGHTTLEQVLAPTSPGAPYSTLTAQQVNEDFVLRDGSTEPDSGAPTARPGRAQTRSSMAYFSQMTDFQLADEESPARVEFLDVGASSAHRPWEALNPFMIDASVRQVNRFSNHSPVPQGDGTGNAMDFSLITGDQADNNQLNETVWVRDLLEGGTPMSFNTGLSNPGDYSNPLGLGASCPAFVLAEGGPGGAAAEGAAYTGVQDVSDYPVDPGANLAYYDPDDVRGNFAAAGFPSYPGLMDRAQQISITPAGLDMPFYLTNGNHDVLVQGNEDANQAFEDIATGCFKALGTTIDPSAGEPDPKTLLFPLSVGMLVPPDPQRQFVSKPQIKEIYGASINGDDDHGFAHVDPAENQASRGSASYYAWNPSETPGFRFISVDTNAEGGVTSEGPISGSSNGNIDDPQFDWLRRELDKAQADGKYVVLFGHHPVRSMTTQVPDEAAAPCTGGDEHGHDVNPGCDLDPRTSTPVHLGNSGNESFVSLINNYNNVLAYVPGHTHENRVTPFKRSNGTVWWELNTSAVADNPQQSRLIDVMDNRDGTLSIFSAILDHASPATAPDPGAAASFDSDQLASIGRTLAYNDPQSGSPNGEGEAKDNNVELLIDNPLPTSADRCKGKQATIVGTPGDDDITGTDGNDVIVTEGGNDVVDAGKGKDLICAGGGKDKVKGGKNADDIRGEGGKDRLKGGSGRDKLKGAGGKDKLGGGRGKDRLNGGPGKDRMNGGKGRDRCVGGPARDRSRSC